MQHLPSLRKTGGAMLAILALSLPAFAGEAHVKDAEVTARGGTWSFSVTIQHDDEGWSHYADRYEIVGPGGEVLGTRVLRHPHSSKPFTRSLAGVTIPADVREVTVRAHDKVHGLGGETLTLTLPEPD
ncbi:hypothetical protein [Yunchengibacter salinarum]|uniref:hypothetical protein n=1 Tax=Yunchengibacter salinarum TaxID=3133399 RepID=UPI0035B5F008